MKEIYLAPSQDTAGRDQLRMAAVRGEAAYVLDLAAADLIKQETQATRVFDPEALAMQRVCSGQPVPAELYGGLDGLVSSLDAAQVLLHAVNNQMSDEESDDPMNRFDTLSSVFDSEEKIVRNLITFLDGDGLVKPWLARDQADPIIEPVSQTTDDPVVVEASKAFDAPCTAFEYELVYGPPDEDGTRPELLSRRCHYALGRVSIIGEFEHVLTVLDSNHPARQTNS